MKQIRYKEVLLITLLGWIPLRLGKKIRNLFYPILFDHYGKFNEIDCSVTFFNCNRIKIHNDVKIQKDVQIKCSPFKSQICLQNKTYLDRGIDIKLHTEDGEIYIGENTYIGPYTCLSGNNIKIGNNCLIASHCGIYANNHIFSSLDYPIVAQGNSYQGIIIEDNCWLGSGVKVIDGVTVGKGSIIGAGAVVTKNIPSYSIAVGVPAKVIKKR